MADIPPRVLDVDTGRVLPLAGVPLRGRGTLQVIGAGGDGAIVIADSGVDARFYGVSGGNVSYLGHGKTAAPGNTGRSAWIRTRNASGCAVREVALDGRVIRRARAFPCSSGYDPAGGSLGLVVKRTRIVEPVSGRTVARTKGGIVAVTGRTVVVYGPGHRYTVLHTASGSRKTMRWPSTLNWSDEPAVDPRGRYVALAFADPAPSGGGQALDVWLLDTRTDRLTQLPGMPARVCLKFTSLAWTNDGRLVLLGESGGNDLVAVWRPGEPRPAVKILDLPERDGRVSDAFAPIG